MVATPNLLSLRIQFEELGNGKISATIPLFSGAVGYGTTKEEARKKAIAIMLSMYRQDLLNESVVLGEGDVIIRISEGIG